MMRALNFLVYSVIAVLGVAVSKFHFGGSEVAAVGLFMLMAGMKEVALGGHVFERSRLPRTLGLFTAVAFLGVSGFALVNQAMAIRDENASSAIVGRVAGAVNQSEKTFALAIDDKQRIVGATEGLLHRLGYRRDEVVGRHMEFLAPDFCLGDIARDLVAVRSPGHNGFILREGKMVAFKKKDDKFAHVWMSVITCRLSVDRVVSSDALCVMLAEQND